jgi:hypothetical protein
MEPHPITTPQFGGLWGQLGCEQKSSVPGASVRSLAELQARVEGALGMHMVECIAKTSEGIAAGKLAGTSEQCLVHSKIRSSGALDLIVRTGNAAFTAELLGFVAAKLA